MHGVHSKLSEGCILQSAHLPHCVPAPVVHIAIHPLSSPPHTPCFHIKRLALITSWNIAAIWKCGVKHPSDHDPHFFFRTGDMISQKTSRIMYIIVTCSDLIVLSLPCMYFFLLYFWKLSRFRPYFSIIRADFFLLHLISNHTLGQKLLVPDISEIFLSRTAKICKALRWNLYTSLISILLNWYASFISKVYLF